MPTQCQMMLKFLVVWVCLYRRQGRWREALANFHRVQELDPRIPHEEEAETAVALRDWKTARVLYRHLLELAPDDIGIKINFAVALMNGEGDFAAARAILETIPYPRYDARGQPIWDDLFLACGFLCSSGTTPAPKDFSSIFLSKSFLSQFLG